MSDNKKYDYSDFDQLDGSHPFKNVCPEGYVDYEARLRPNAKI